MENKIAIHDLCRFWKYPSAKKYENQNSNETYTNKHQKNVFSNDGYKLVCVGDTFNKAYLCEDGIYSFINSIGQRK